MLLSELEFWSFLAYSPRGESPILQKSRQVMLMLKNDRQVGDPARPMSRLLAGVMREHLDGTSPVACLGPDVTLVPAPKSSKLVKGGLWVPSRIAEALVEVGLGREVVACLERVRAVPKAAFCSPDDRPKPATHYETIAVPSPILPATRFVIVDDVVTRGATLLGAASRLSEAYPQASIRAFAVMRTVSNPDEFREIRDPVMGKIVYRSGEAYRTVAPAIPTIPRCATGPV